MKLQAVLITLVAFAVTGTYAAENGANACFRTCEGKPKCPGGVR